MLSARAVLAGVEVKGKGIGPVIRAAGMMSGTSLDGVDIAVVHTDGHIVAGFGATAYRPYSGDERAVLRAALGIWPGEQGVAEAARVVEDAHIAAFLSADLREPQDDASSEPSGPDLGPIALVGVHGQTLAHDPQEGRTHQAGDGARIAAALGIDTVWDFRSTDMALGGQGAPLAPFFHWAAARWAGLGAPVVFVNLGGVGNLTWLDPTAERPEEPGALLAFDTGPANAPLDDTMQARGLGDRDEGGALALSGTVDQGVVSRFLQSEWFEMPPPKSLDRLDFAALADGVAALSDADALATLTACTALSVAQGLRWCPSPPELALICGGGRHNAALMAALADHMPCAVYPVEHVGLDGDALEAQAFAYLAVRVARGLPTSAPGTTGVAAAVAGGQINRVGTAPQVTQSRRHTRLPAPSQ